MILKSIELSVYPNKKGKGIDGKVYYNALDIKALKNDSDVLGINSRIIEDACYITRMFDSSFSDNGIVLYDNLIDLFSYTLLNDDNQLLVGLKEMSIEKLIKLLDEMIKIVTDNNISFYLTIDGKVNIICDESCETISNDEYDNLINQINNLVINELPTDEIVLPKKEVKNFSYKNMQTVIDKLKNKINEKEKILDDLNRQIVEIESLIEENEFLDKQILDSKKRIEDISKNTDDNLL